MMQAEARGRVTGVGLAAAMWIAVAGHRFGTGRHVSQFKAATCRRTPHWGSRAAVIGCFCFMVFEDIVAEGLDMGGPSAVWA